MKTDNEKIVAPSGEQKQEWTDEEVKYWADLSSNPSPSSSCLEDSHSHDCPCDSYREGLIDGFDFHKKNFKNACRPWIPVSTMGNPDDPGFYEVTVVDTTADPVQRTVARLRYTIIHGTGHWCVVYQSDRVIAYRKQDEPYKG